MERKMKSRVKVDIPMANVTRIAIGGIVIKHQELEALFLSEKREYTYVKTDEYTYSVYPYPLDN